MNKSPHLVIHKGVWHFRLFQWSLRLLDHWKGGTGRYEANFEYGASLFHYFRVLCVYMPLILLSNALTWGWAVFMIFVLPIQVGSGWEYLQFQVVLVLGCLVLGCLWICAGAWAYTEREHAKHAPTLVMMVKRWIRAKQRKIVPMITFVEKDK